MRGIRLADTWDIAAFLLLLPLVVLMAGQLPGHWENNRGKAMSGIARSPWPSRSGQGSTSW